MTTAQELASAPRIIPAEHRGRIVQKIYRVWLVRRLLPVLIVEVAALTFLLFQIGRAAFVQRIAENALTVFFARPEGIAAFAVSMFTHASAGEKFLSLAAVVFIAFLLRHLTQGMLRWILVRENYFQSVKNRE
ncbi:MAG: hypothetical protein AAB539_00350 [Patescibacteria group bacterium]